MRLPTVQVTPQRVLPRSVATAAGKGSVCGNPAPMRQLSPHSLSFIEAPARPNILDLTEPAWVPTASASDESIPTPLEHLWCRALPDQLSSEDPSHLPLAPLVMHFDESTTFLVKVDEPPAPPGKQKHPDYYANVGDAIRTLREDLPQLFYKDLNYDIYREDIVFRDPRLTFQGMKNYKLIFWSLRFHGKLFFSKLYVDILRVWQPEDNSIKIRWRITGIPRVWWKTEGNLDGISIYKLDSDGKIFEHAVTDVQLRDPPIRLPQLYGLNYILSPQLQGQGGQLPCPGAWVSPDATELPQSSAMPVAVSSID